MNFLQKLLGKKPKRENKLVFVSFGDSRMVKSACRIKRQARRMRTFDAVHIMNENDLTPRFREKMKRHLISGSRGFGYWSWKPQCILQTLETMNDGDLLLYADIGCHLASRRRRKLMELFDMVARSEFGVMGFQYPENTERFWTKGDLFDHFGVRDNPEITESGQVVATTLFIRKNPNTMQFVRDWVSVFENHFHLCDDTPSKSGNLPGFRENRHDQSVYSILCKLRGTDKIVGVFTCYPRSERSWRKYDFPIQARRDSGRVKIKRHQ